MTWLTQSENGCVGALSEKCGQQDYVAGGNQPWLDGEQSMHPLVHCLHVCTGFCTEPGVVRQFVAAALGEGKTVEEQLTGHAEKGGIQVDIIPAFPETPYMQLLEHGKPTRELVDASVPFPPDSEVQCRLYVCSPQSR